MRRGIAVALIAATAVACSGNGNADKANKLAHAACIDWTASQAQGRAMAIRAADEAQRAAQLDSKWSHLAGDLDASAQGLAIPDDPCAKVH